MEQTVEDLFRHISIALYHLQAGASGRSEVLGSILSYICDYYICVDNICCPEDIPLCVYSLLHDYFGLEFIIRAGKISSVSVDSGGGYRRLNV